MKELLEWRKSNKIGPGSGRGKAGRKKPGKVEIAAAVREQMAVLQKEAKEEQQQESAIKNCILSVVQGGGGGTKRQRTSAQATAAETQDNPTSSLNQILKKVKFSS